MDKIEIMNERILSLLSYYLNECSTRIDVNMVKRLKESCAISDKEAFSILLAIELGIDFDENEEDRYLYDHYFDEMIHELNSDIYKEDLYYATIEIPERKIGAWEFKKEKYQPYELFVMNDMVKKEDGRIIPQLGFFKEEFSFPVVLQSKREWMLITPNEIETMKDAILQARGRVLTSGLGLGYFAYLCSEKEEVESIDIIERDPELISLFETVILPQIPHQNKIKIHCSDAFVYFEKNDNMENIDFVFWDLWHDVGDGLEMYRKLKSLEGRYPKINFTYWIEKTLKCYIED